MCLNVLQIIDLNPPSQNKKALPDSSTCIQILNNKAQYHFTITEAEARIDYLFFHLTNLSIHWIQSGLSIFYMGELQSEKKSDNQPLLWLMTPKPQVHLNMSHLPTSTYNRQHINSNQQYDDISAQRPWFELQFWMQVPYYAVSECVGARVCACACVSVCVHVWMWSD